MSQKTFFFQKLMKTENYRLNPYEKKVLVSIGSNTFFALTYWKFAKKVLDPILTNTFFYTGRVANRDLG